MENPNLIMYVVGNGAEMIQLSVCVNERLIH